MGSGRETHFGEGVPEADRRALQGALAGLVARAMPHPWTADQLGTALADPRARLRVRAGEAEPGPIAFVLGRAVASDLLEIDLVAVDPAQRRRGVGRALLEGFLAEAVVAGARECRLELAGDDAAALGLYVGVGFVVVGRRERYYPDGADALLLSWRAPEG